MRFSLLGCIAVVATLLPSVSRSDQPKYRVVLDEEFSKSTGRRFNITGASEIRNGTLTLPAGSRLTPRDVSVLKPLYPRLRIRLTLAEPAKGRSPGQWIVRGFYARNKHHAFAVRFSCRADSPGRVGKLEILEPAEFGTPLKRPVRIADWSDNDKQAPRVSGEWIVEYNYGYITVQKSGRTLIRGMVTTPLTKTQVMLPTASPIVRCEIESLAGRPMLNALRLESIADPLSGRLPDIAELRRGLELDKKSRVSFFRQDWEAGLQAAREAVDVRSRVFGPDHVNTAISHTNLGGLLVVAKRWSEGLKHLRRSREILVAELGPDHPMLADVEHYLAGALRYLGLYCESLKSSANALRIGRAAYGNVHPSVATELNNQASFHLGQGNLPRAVALLSESAKIHKQLATAPKTGSMLLYNNKTTLPMAMEVLAKTSYYLTRDADQSLEYYAAARLLRVKVNGSDEHPDLIDNWSMTGIMQRRKGNLVAAEACARKALKISLAAHGSLAWKTNVCRGNLASILLTGDTPDRKRMAEATRLVRAAWKYQIAHLQRVFASLSEHQQNRLRADNRYVFDSYLRLAAKAKLPPREVHQAVLDWKGAVFAQQRLARRAGRSIQSANDWKLVRVLSRRLTRIQRFRHRKPKYEQLAQDWERQIDRLLERIAQREKLPELHRVTTAAVAKALPKLSVLIDFVATTRWQPGRDGKGRIEERLLAFVVSPDNAVVMKDLGEMKPIRSAIAQWHRDSGTARNRIPGNKLRTALWEPLRSAIDNAKVILVSPDDALWSLPLAALPSGKSEYLIHRHAFVRVPVPRMLPAYAAQKLPTSKDSLLLVGAFDPPQDAGSNGRLQRSREVLSSAAADFRSQANQRDVQSLRGESAVGPQIIKASQANSNLFLFLHAVYDASLVKNAEKARLQAFDPAFDSSPAVPGGLISSGIQLKDGVLPALLVGTLDLEHVNDVFLWGCQTAGDSVLAGEGVYGLSRSFALAGAKRLTTSLWSVDEDATARIARSFTSNLWVEELGHAESLRRAQLQQIAEGRANARFPRYWAAWTINGAPGSFARVDPTYRPPVKGEPVAANEASPEQAEAGNPLILGIAGFGILAVLCGVVWIRKRRSEVAG